MGIICAFTLSEERKMLEWVPTIKPGLSSGRRLDASCSIFKELGRRLRVSPVGTGDKKPASITIDAERNALRLADNVAPTSSRPSHLAAWFPRRGEVRSGRVPLKSRLTPQRAFLFSLLGEYITLAFHGSGRYLDSASHSPAYEL